MNESSTIFRWTGNHIDKLENVRGVKLVFLFPLQLLLENKLSSVRCVGHLDHNCAAPEQGRQKQTMSVYSGSNYS